MKNDGGSTFTCAACKPLIAPMTDEQAKAKIIAMLVSCREFCSDPDMRNSFLGWKDRSLGRELLPRGLAKLAAHIVFEQSEEGLDKMREAFDAAISAISTTKEADIQESDMAGWQRRVVLEKNEITGKMDNLKKFMGLPSDAHARMDPDGRDRLRRQYYIMSLYQMVLTERIKNFQA